MENNRYTDTLRDVRGGVEHSNDLGWGYTKDKLYGKASKWINSGIDKFRSNQDHTKYAPGESPTEFAQKNISDYQKQHPDFEATTSYSNKSGNIPGIGYTAPNLSPGLSKAVSYTNGYTDIRAPDNPTITERVINPNYDVFEHPSESKIKDLIYRAHETYEAGNMKDQRYNGVANILKDEWNPINKMKMDFDGTEISSHVGLGVLAREASLLNGLLQKYPNDPNVIKAVQNLYSHRNENGEYDVLSGFAQKDIGDINSTSLPSILEKIKAREESQIGNNYNYDDEVLSGSYPVKSPVFDMDPEKLSSIAGNNFMNFLGNNSPVGAVKDAGKAISNMFENSTLEKIDHLISSLE